MTIKSHADKENGMTAALVEMKAETKNPSENKSRVPHCERKKRGSSAWWNGVERLFACLKYTRNFISLSGNHIQHITTTAHMGNVRLNETKIGERNSKHNQQQHLCLSNILE
jgi:hypothetical protein